MNGETQAALDEVMIAYARLLGDGNHVEEDSVEEQCHVLGRDVIRPDDPSGPRRRREAEGVRAGSTKSSMPYL